MTDADPVPRPERRWERYNAAMNAQLARDRAAADATPDDGPAVPAGSVPTADWTDGEWLRVIAEFRPDTAVSVVEAAVYRWRAEAAAG